MTGVLLAVAGAFVAGSFAARLWRDWRKRQRHHALSWALSLTLYGVGMLALAAGLLIGWTTGTYGVYWLTGALLNVPLLAVGELHLLDPARRRLWWALAVVAAVWALVAVLTSRFDPGALRAATVAGGIPLGVDVFAEQPAYAALQPLTLTGMAVVLVGSAWSALRHRRAAVLLIVLGVAVAGSSSVFVRSDLDALVPVALAVGVTIMYAGFRATTGRSRRGARGVRSTSPT